MTKEEAIKILRHWGSNTPATDRDCAVKMAIEALEKPEPHWIPVTERLPEKWNTAYIATLDYGEYGMAVGRRFFFGDNIGWNDEAVIAWMPFPEPYKGVTS